MKGRRHLATAALLSLVAACQPETRRVLVLDLALSESGAVAAVAAPWRRAGYEVDYRRFYPHPTRADAGQYRVLILLGGLAPEAPSDALRPSDLAQLSEWVQDGGVVIVGYAGDGEGSLDRWMLNRWLAALGTGIAIGDSALRDSASRHAWITPRKDGPVRGGGVLAFPAGRNHPLIAPRGAVLASAAQAPAIAAVRVEDGLVVVASRHALGSLGAEVRVSTAPFLAGSESARTRTFFVALARWILRPAEWAHVPPARPPEALDLSGPPRELSAVPQTDAPPAGATTEALTGPIEPTVPTLPAWTRRQGFRVLREDGAMRPGMLPSARARALDSLVEFMEAGSLTALWMRAAVAPLADTTLSQQWERDVLRASWKQVGERLQTTSIRWLLHFDLSEARVPPDTAELDAWADRVARWPALDARLWDDVLRPANRALARLAADQPDVAAGIVLELPSYGMGAGFSEATFRVGLEGTPGDSAWKGSLQDVPARARFDSLLERGRLAAFYAALERAVAQRALVLRNDLRRIAPGRSFGIRVSRPTLDWFTNGLVAGLGDSATAVWLFTDEARNTHSGAVIPIVRLTPGQFTGARSRLADVIFGPNGGFWLDGHAGQGAAGGAPDSLARLVRRLSRDARLPEAPARR